MKSALADLSDTNALVLEQLVKRGRNDIPSKEFYGETSWEDVFEEHQLGMFDEVELAEGLLEFLDKQIKFTDKHYSVTHSDRWYQTAQRLYDNLNQAFNIYIDEYTNEISSSTKVEGSMKRVITAGYNISREDAISTIVIHLDEAEEMAETLFLISNPADRRKLREFYQHVESARAAIYEIAKSYKLII